jgi:hypothetical protein
MRVTAIFAFTHFYSSYYQYLFLSYSPTSSKDHQRTDEKWVQKIDQYLIQTLTLSNLQSVVNTYWRHVVYEENLLRSSFPPGTNFIHRVSWWNSSTRNKFYPLCHLMEFFHQKQILSTVSFDGNISVSTQSCCTR